MKLGQCAQQFSHANKANIYKRKITTLNQYILVCYIYSTKWLTIENQSGIFPFVAAEAASDERRATGQDFSRAI